MRADYLVIEDHRFTADLAQIFVGFQALKRRTEGCLGGCFSNLFPLNYILPCG